MQKSPLKTNNIDSTKTKYATLATKCFCAFVLKTTFVLKNVLHKTQENRQIRQTAQKHKKNAKKHTSTEKQQNKIRKRQKQTKTKKHLHNSQININFVCSFKPQAAQNQKPDMMTFNLRLPEYLRQWLIDAMGGQTPVTFPKGSAFTSYLRVFLRHKREMETLETAGEETVEITVPRFPGRDPQYYNHLPASARDGLVSLIRDAFDVELYTEMSAFRNATNRKKGAEILAVWMEEHGIDPNDRNTCAVLKRLQLLKRRARDRDRKRLGYSQRPKSQKAN